MRTGDRVPRDTRAPNGVGVSKRFGLLFVDYGTQRRTPKRSAEFYSRVARTNELAAPGVVLGEPTAAGARMPS